MDPNFNAQHSLEGKRIGFGVLIGSMLQSTKLCVMKKGEVFPVLTWYQARQTSENQYAPKYIHIK